MNKIRKGIILLAAFGCVSCNAIQSFIHDDDVVAKVGKHKLYKSELVANLPQGVSSADSTNLALQYINSWASSQIYSDMALSQLPKADRDVTEELEAYKRSLLRYRYEQQYVNDRLDTLITEEQMMDFYNSNQALFNLTAPIVKVRYIDILKTSDQKDYLIRKMSSNKAMDVVMVDSLARLNAIRYFDNSQTWMDAAELAKEFGVDYNTMLSKIQNNYITFESRDMSDVKCAYVREIKRKGVAPFDYSIDRIKEYILSERKYTLLKDLEQALLREASDKGSFLIY